MLNNLKACIRKWVDLTHEDFFKLLRWSTSRVEFDNRTLVASCSRDGETIAYLTAEPVYLIGSYAVCPNITPSDALSAGDVIDAALASEAKRVGVGKFLITLPEGAPRQHDEIVLRVIVRTIPQTNGDAKQLSERLPEVNNPTPTAVWIN